MKIKQLFRKAIYTVIDLKFWLTKVFAPSLIPQVLNSKLEGSYLGELCKEINQQILELEESIIAEEIVARLFNKGKELASRGEFDTYIDYSKLKRMQSEELVKCYGYHSQRRWKLQFFYMPKGSEHPVHAHHNLDSFLIVLKGRIWVKEYKRIDVSHSGKIKIQATHNRTIEPHNGILTTEFNNNIHQFGALDDTVCLNFNLRGYNKKTFYEDHKGFGRRYIHIKDQLMDEMEIKYAYK